MTIPELLGGPYAAPECKVGDWLDDEVDGALAVGGWTIAPIPWPRRKKTGRHSLILCGDLVQAVKLESAEAICHYWGVGPTKVWQWRQALGVGRVTDGTRQLLQERTGVPPKAAARGRKKIAGSPEIRARIAESLRGRPVHPNTLPGLQKGWTRKKGQEWGVLANAWMRGEQLPKIHSGEWTAQELMQLRDEYLRGRSARAVARILGRTLPAVLGQIDSLGLAGAPRKKWRSKA